MFQVTTATIILLLTSAVVSLTALLVWRRRELPVGRELFWLFCSVLVWSLAAALSSSSTNVAFAVFWSKVEYIGSATTAPFTLLFCIRFTHRDAWLTQRRMLALWALPALIVFLALTNGAHRLIWLDVILSDTPRAVPYMYQHGPLFWVYLAYNYLYTLAGGLLLLQAYVRSGPLYRKQSGAILFSMLFPWMGGILYVLDLFPIHGLDITPVSFSFTAIIIAWGLSSSRLLDLIPIAHSVLLQSMQDPVIVMDHHDRVVEANPAMAHVLGHLELPVGLPASETFSEWPALAALLVQRPHLRSEVSLLGDTQRYFDVRITPVRDRLGQDKGHIAVLREVTRRKQAELALEARSREMEQQAITDELTGLYNRRYINRLLNDEFGRAVRYGVTLSIALLDIDGFKQINDTFGHAAGDQALRQVSQVLQTDLRANDVASRFGGDEFLVILPHTDSKGAFQVMERVRNRMQAELFGPEGVRLSCSVGLTSRVPEDTQESLLKRADQMLYTAKEQGRNRVLRGASDTLRLEE